MGKVSGNWISGAHSGRACRRDDIYTKVNNPRHGLCCKVGHSYKRGGGDKRERSREDRATAQALHFLPHLHLRLHPSPTRPLFLDKNPIQAIGCQSIEFTVPPLDRHFLGYIASIPMILVNLRTRL